MRFPGAAHGRVGAGVSWSPDGTRIAFFEESGGLYRLSTVGLDGARPVPLVRDTAGENPAWSPDGTRIAFTDNADVCVASADGSGLERLTFAAYDDVRGNLAKNVDPAWQPLRPGSPPAGLPVTPSGPPADWARAYSWGWGCSESSLVFKDLALTGTAEPTRVSTGGVATFSLAVENRGDAPIGAAGLVALGGVLDGGARVVSAAATRGLCQTGPGPDRESPPLVLECYFGSLFPDESVAVTLRLHATAPGELALRVSLPRPAVVGEASTGWDLVRRVRVAGCTRLGTQGADVVRGSLRTDVLCGFDGDDRIQAGEARDKVYAGPGADTIVVRDGAPDYVSCGAGRDKVFADRFDRLDRDCELAKRR